MQLNAYWFEDLEQLRIISEKWRTDYNENHPPQSLGKYHLISSKHWPKARILKTKS